VVLLVVVACRAPKPGVSPCIAASHYSNPERLAAMMSVHGHAIWTEPQLSALELKLMPLGDALQVLRCDAGAGSVSRRLRASAKLLGYSWKTPRFNDELATLGVKVPAVEAELDKRYGRLLPAVERNPEWLTAVIQNLFFEKQQYTRVHASGPREENAGPCQGNAEPGEGNTEPSEGNTEPGNVSTTPCGDSIRVDVPNVVVPNGPSFALGTTVSVISTLDKVEQALDPRRWAQCSLLWTDTYTAKVSAATGVPITQSSDPCKAEQGPGNGTPGFGETFSGPRPLYEHFNATSGSASSIFDIVLRVNVTEAFDAGLGTLAHTVDYRLWKPDGFLCGSIDGIDTTVIMDRGYLRMWQETGGRVSVGFVKDVGYANAVTTGLAQSVVTYHTFSSELGDIACCLKRQP
jgi:hypothetical protein